MKDAHEGPRERAATGPLTPNRKDTTMKLLTKKQRERLLKNGREQLVEQVAL